MKKLIALLVGLTLLLSFTACSMGTDTADKGNDGIIEDAGDAVNNTLNGAENVVDNMTGSDSANNTNSSNDTNTTTK